MDSGFCFGSSFKLLDDGLIPLCFMDLVLFGANTLFIFLLGIWRYRELRRLPTVDIPWTKITKAKIAVSMLIALTHLIRSFVDVFSESGRLYSVLADFYITLSWIFSVFLIFAEYSRGEKNNWVLRTWWTTSFILYSLSLQTTINLFKKDPNMALDLFFSLFWEVMVVFLATVGLFFNRVSSSYQALRDIPEEEEVPHAKGGSSPERTASLLSQWVFGWINPLLRLGSLRALQQEDLYPLFPSFGAARLEVTLDSAWRKQLFKTKPSLIRASWQAFGGFFLKAGIYKFIHDCLVFVGPVLIQRLIAFVRLDSDEPDYLGYLYALALCVSSLCQSVLLHQYFWTGYRAGMMTRGALTAMVYNKAFKLNSRAKKESTLGEMVNLQSIDAYRLQELIPYLHMIWSAPLQTIVSIVLLWRVMGPSILAGIAVMVLVVPVNGFFAKKLMGYQKTVMAQRDQRTKLMNEVLSGMRVIKFFAWESSFLGQIGVIRNNEMNILKRSLVIRSLSIFFWAATPVMVSVTTFGAYTLGGGVLTADRAFTALALFNIIRFPLNILPSLLSQLAEAAVSFRRLQKFLLSEELDPQAVEYSTAPSEYAVEISHGSFQWEENGPRTLEDISIKFPKGKLVAIVGTVGSGKSSVLSAVLGEIPKVSGHVTVRGSTAYVSQQAWVQNATLRENILFGSPFDGTRYDYAIRVSELAGDIDMLPSGDQTEIGERGINLSGGQKQRVSIARALYQDMDIYLLDDSLSAVDAHVGKKIFDNAIAGALKKKTRLLVTHQLQFVSYADWIVVLGEGKVQEEGTYEDLMKSKGAFSSLIENHVKETAKYETKEEEETVPEATAPVKPPSKETGKMMTTEERETGNITWQVWKGYIVAMGGLLVALFIFTMYFADAGSRVGGDIWLSYWSSSGEASHSYYYLGIYTLLGIASGLFIFIRNLLISLASLNSARILHESMIQSVIRAPMSFFDTTPLGRILNRFTKDINTIDETLPRSVGMLLSMLFNTVSVIFAIVFATPFFSVALLPLTYFYRYVQKYYLESSRELKRLESISRSPIYAQFSETLTGLGTIRPYRRVQQFQDINNEKLDANLSGYYLLTAANRWMGVRLEFIGTVVVTLSALFAVIERGSVGAGFAGLSLTYALQLTGVLNWLARQFTDTETQLVSVERAMNYSKLESEAPLHVPENTPPSDWPAEGVIRFEHVKLRYREGLDLVLKGISLSINSKEKVGVVGRTGAGKSSLMLALFRLVELSEGKILIDGVDIATIGLHDLRKVLSIIPQDPTLFNGTIRSNLDPFHESTDLEIWEALASVHLRALIERMPEKLEAPVSEFGENFSVGQRQLLCLGRALLRRAKVLVMDEATAAVDFETDALIQKTIRKEFVDVTVLTIAHRINTIMDYDRVLVMDKGLVAEFDSPAKLDADPNSIFHSLVSHSGTKDDRDSQVNGME